MWFLIPKRVVEREGSGDNADDFAGVERQRISKALVGRQPVGARG